MSSLLGVVSGPGAEVEYKLDQFRDMAGILVGESCRYVHYGLYDTNGNGLIYLGR